MLSDGGAQNKVGHHFACDDLVSSGIFTSSKFSERIQVLTTHTSIHFSNYFWNYKDKEINVPQALWQK